MSGVHSGFEGGTILLPLGRILPTRKISKDVRKSQKYRAILASIREVGIIEPLAVFPEKDASDENRLYVLLDGHLRLEALKELGATEAVCLVSTDDEGFTYNKRINRLSAVQEHMMILRAIEKGLAPERIALALNVNVDRIRERQRLLDGIAPEVVEMLKDRIVGQAIFKHLRKMKPVRQIAAAEMMSTPEQKGATAPEQKGATRWLEWRKYEGGPIGPPSYFRLLICPGNQGVRISPVSESEMSAGVVAPAEAALRRRALECARR
jgi:ParB-like chromosome segregation protein Spo0J